MIETFALATLLSLASDDGWPQYNGAGGDRTSADASIATTWGEDGPDVVWRVPTNLGFSSFTVADGMALTLVARNVGDETFETCVAIDVATGEERWATPVGFGAPEYDRGGDAGAGDNTGGDGARSTPSFDDGRVYTLDSNLVLTALDATNGETLWVQDLIADFHGRNIQWQNAASPLVEGELVLVAGGGPDESLLAFHKVTGELEWARGDELITHATPVAATIHGVRQVLFFLQSGLVAVEPVSGEELWRAEYPYKVSTAASPVVSGDVVFVSAGYGVGGGAFRIVEKGGEFSAELLWQKRNKLVNHWSTPVCKDGYLYGMFSFKEYGEGPLKCVELATGEEKWSTEGFGPGNVILVGDTLVALSDAGEVVLVAADPAEYTEHARAKVLDGKCWSTPVVADGQLYVRSSVEGKRIDLSASELR